MTVIRPNGISGVTSITSSGDAINFYRSDGTLGPELGINVNVTSGVSTFAALNVTGVLTYEDVASVDSVGIITARSTIDAKGDISIADKIIHTGDTNTAIRFPAADTITAETSGSERLRIDSSGRLLVGPTSTSTPGSVVIQGNSTGSSSYGLLRLAKGSTTPADGDALGLVAFGDGNHNTNAQISSKRDGGTWNSGSSHPTRIEFNTTSDGQSGSSERLRITSAGSFQITDPSSSTGLKSKISFVTESPHQDEVVYIGFDRTASAGGAPTDLTFATGTVGGVSERLRINSAGTSIFTTTARVATFTGNGIEVNYSSGSNVFIGTQSGTEGKIGTINNAAMSLYANNDYAKRAELAPSGNFTLYDGNLVLASGHGIDFSSTGNPSGMTSELLDDYEEGTFTPAFPGTTSISPAPTGHYVRVGSKVTVWINITNATVGGTHNGTISDLPFSGGSHRAGGFSISAYGIFNTADTITAVVESGQTNAYLLKTVANSSWASVGISPGSNRYLHLTMTYEV